MGCRYVPDPKVPLTAKGWEQALDAGEKLKSIVEADCKPYRLFFYTSPYLRSKQVGWVAGWLAVDPHVGACLFVELAELCRRVRKRSFRNTWWLGPTF